jgi:hypothetical protein
MMVERRPRRPPAPERAADKDFRCCCGSLLAHAARLQLNCRRCKRTLFTGEPAAGRAPPES